MTGRNKQRVSGRFWLTLVIGFVFRRDIICSAVSHRHPTTAFCPVQQRRGCREVYRNGGPPAPPAPPLCRRSRSHRHHSSRRRRGINVRPTVDSEPDAGRGKRRKKKKKNKYGKFSKVDGRQKDPFDLLLDESERKGRELEEELLRRRRRGWDDGRASRPSIPDDGTGPSSSSWGGRMEFPDNGDIDPYDPATFGYVEVGTVIGSHGVRGWVKVRSATDFPLQRLCTAGIRHLRPAGKRAPRRIALIQGRRRHNDEFLVQLGDVRDRDAAMKLRGATLYVREEEKDIRESDEEYLVSDLVGLDVFLANDDGDDDDDDVDGTGNEAPFVGTVGGVVFADEMCSVPGLGHDMLEVVLPRGRGGAASFRDELVLIPFVPQIVPRVEPRDGAVYIDPPPGLLDLTYVRTEKVRIKGFLPPAS